MTGKCIRWIPVTTSEGMFTAEYAVSLELADGKHVSFFVDKSQVQESHGEHRLKVTVVSCDDTNRRQSVLLPTETFETSSRWVEVPA